MFSQDTTPCCYFASSSSQGNLQETHRYETRMDSQQREMNLEKERRFANNMVDVCQKYGIRTDLSYMEPELKYLKQSSLFNIAPVPQNLNLTVVSRVALSGDYAILCRVIGTKGYLTHKSTRPKVSDLEFKSPDSESEVPAFSIVDMTTGKVDPVELTRKGIHFYHGDEHIYGLPNGKDQDGVLRHNDGMIFRSWQGDSTVDICNGGCPDPTFSFFTPVDNFGHYFCLGDEYYFYLNHQGHALIYHAGSLSCCGTIPFPVTDVLGGKFLHALTGTEIVTFSY